MATFTPKGGPLIWDYERTHDRQIANMGGLAGATPLYATLFGFFTLASLGLPGLAGFVGEFLVIVGTRQGIGGRYVVLPIAILLLISVHAMATARRQWAVGVGSAVCLVAFVSGCHHGDNDDSHVGEKHACKGQNSCKGKGNCKTAEHACKGQNSCKSQGGCKSSCKS